mgnify:CR=1 FL=1
MKITKVLITGIAGSGGSYLAEYIANNHPEVEINGLAYSRSTRINLKTLGKKIVRYEKKPHENMLRMFPMHELITYR